MLKLEDIGTEISKVVENILDSGEPGCTAGCIEGFENLVGRRLIKDSQDGITNSPIIKEIIGTTLGILKILAKFIDLIKDLALTIVMLEAWVIHNILNLF